METFGCQSETLSNNWWSLIDLAVQSHVLNCLESSSSSSGGGGGVFMKGLLSAKSRLKIMHADPRKWASDLSAAVCSIIYKPSRFPLKVVTFPPPSGGEKRVNAGPLGATLKLLRIWKKTRRPIKTRRLYKPVETRDDLPTPTCKMPLTPRYSR